MKKAALAIFVLVVSGAAAFVYLGNRSASVENVISVSGNMEVTDVELSFKLAGRVQERLLSEGQSVRAGQVVARLEDAELAREVALRRAEVEAAQAALAELEAGSRPEEIAQARAAARQAEARLQELLAGSRLQEVAAAEATVQRARAETERLRAEYMRHKTLHEEGIISAQLYDSTRAAYEVAKAREKESEEQLKLVREGPRKEQIDQAREALEQARERLAIVEKGPRIETIDQARARLQQAREALSLAETRFGYATLASPISGVVLSDNIEPGEYVAPGVPVITVADLGNVWLRAYINETDLGRVKLGQLVCARTDTYPGKRYQGRVTFIASQAEFTPKNVQTEKERVKLVYRAKIGIANPEAELKPGMPADALIMLDGRAQGCTP